MAVLAYYETLSEINRREQSVREQSEFCFIVYSRRISSERLSGSFWTTMTMRGSLQNFL